MSDEYFDEEGYYQYMEEVRNMFHMKQERVESLVEEGKTEEAKVLLREMEKEFDVSFVEDEWDALTKLVGEN